MTPHESVVFWTEYVLKYNGAKHLKTAAADMPLYQYLLLDIFAFVIFIVIASSWIFFNVMRKIILFFYVTYFVKNSTLKEKKIC